MELTRGIRNQLTSLVAGLSAQDLRPMSLGLSHSLSRYKLKFSPDKVDTMIVQVRSQLAPGWPTALLTAERQGLAGGAGGLVNGRVGQAVSCMDHQLSTDWLS